MAKLQLDRTLTADAVRKPVVFLASLTGEPPAALATPPAGPTPPAPDPT
jgi:hypothetical protein